MKGKNTYQTKKEAQKAASYNKGFVVYKVKEGWRTRLRSPNKKKARKSESVSVKAYSRKQAKNLQRVTFTAKVTKVLDLINDYLRTKAVKDDVLRQKVLDKPPFETNWTWLVNILNEELASLQNKIEVLLK